MFQIQTNMNKPLHNLGEIVFRFVFCLFVGIKPQNPYVASSPGLEVKPLGVFPLM